MKKVLIGISGGVDSAASAYLLKKQGYEVVGVTFLLFDQFKYSIEDAKQVCESLEIPHMVADWRTSFKREIIDYFVETYKKGETPNPCIRCNEMIKYGKFLELADDLGADYISTGHYAEVVSVEDNLTVKQLDSSKDQSYFLYRLNQNVLKRVIFPLSAISTKLETREIAREAKLFVAEKKDSQEICFIPRTYKEFLKDFLVNHTQKGYFVDEKGMILGEHEGIWNYTIGQRKGLNIAFGEPRYVIHIDSDKNQVILGKNEDLFRTKLKAEHVNWIFEEAKNKNQNVDIKIRYNGPSSKGKFSVEEDGSIIVTFEEPVRAITPGQSVVLYHNQLLLGGGIISSEFVD